MVEPAPLRHVPGLTIGHATLPEARTGCTVIAFDHPALSAVDVRGAAPGTRELDLLAPGRSVQRADAILLTGGSAFGLRAADGVMQALAERGRGYPTPAGPVPIVPAAVIYDLANGDPISPGPEHGRQALEHAVSLNAVSQGRVGAGTGATWGKLATPGGNPGGIGIAQIPVEGGLVTAVVVLNATGSIGHDPRRGVISSAKSMPEPGQATTLISVVTTLPCTHDVLIRLCVAAHDALARIVVPSHTILDGDVAFASTLNEGPIDQAGSLRLCLATEIAVESAILAAAGRG